MVNKKQLAQILDLLKDGLTLNAACREVGVKRASDVLDLTKRDTAFEAQYARAREIGYHQMADTIINIADDHTIVDTNARRLMVDTRKWLLSKALPKYADKPTQIDVKGNVSLVTSKEDEKL